MQSFIMNSNEVFIHIHQGCFAGTGAIVRLPQCQWSKPDGYGKISQCMTTTKHSKAKTVCIFLGIYCIKPCGGKELSYKLYITTTVLQSNDTVLQHIHCSIYHDPWHPSVYACFNYCMTTRIDEAEAYWILNILKIFQSFSLGWNCDLKYQHR